METHCACGFAWVASIRYSVAYSGTVEWSNGIPENIKATVRSASVPFWLQKLKNTLVPFKSGLGLAFEVTSAAILVPFAFGAGGAVEEPLTALLSFLRPASLVFKRHVKFDSKYVQNEQSLSARQASQQSSVVFALVAFKSKPARFVLLSKVHLDWVVGLKARFTADSVIVQFTRWSPACSWSN